MIYEQTSLNEVTVTFDSGEDILASLVDVTARAEADTLCWNLFLILELEQWSPIRMKLQDLGFMPAGFLTADARSRVKLRKSIRRSGMGQNLDTAIREPEVTRSQVEIHAIESFFAQRPEYKEIWQKHHGQLSKPETPYGI